MNKKRYTIEALHSIHAMDIAGFDKLIELTLDLRWSWLHAVNKLWRQIDSDLWDHTQNPWVLLQTVSSDKIKQAFTDPVFSKNLNALVALRRERLEETAWFQKTYKNSSLKCIAYFCMEFMLSETLPIYSGGLGNVAGDLLKTASDLGVPVIGIGLLYQQGYFRQVIDKEGAQQAFFPYNDFWQLPIMPLRDSDGEWIRLQLDLPDLPIWLRIWQVQVGRVKLYLLDSNDAANFPPYRVITNELYGGRPYDRFMQELVLGIGGWQLLTLLGKEPEICHLNEGHAAFAVLERARNFMKKSGQSFEVALAATRAGNLFTTHTAVAAGFDRFEPTLIEQYLGNYAEQQLGISRYDLLALGRVDPNNVAEEFNMAYLAIRGSSTITGVSHLHEKVSQYLFSPLFPRWPIDEIPVKHVTNGIHTPSWDSVIADELWAKACGKKRWLEPTENLGKYIRFLSDAEIWQFRAASSKLFIEFVRKRLTSERAISGEIKGVNEAKDWLSPHTLTLGFARRFATYKRPDLLLHNRERLLRLLSNPERPVQLVIAGKAHPADLAGQALIKEWLQFIRHPEVRQHIVFLSDHDILLTKHLVQGVDVWLNTPRRPWEACGTSGMKVLVNGGINLSELDGWWAEAYTPEVGWALGDGRGHGDDPAWDVKEAENLFDLLENKVVPEFYTRDKTGIPTAWIARMRESMVRLTPQFSSNRMLREYVEEHYLPAAKIYKERVANNGEFGVQLINWRHLLCQKWAALHFGELKIKTEGEQYVFEIQVYCNDLDPKYVRVELYANAVNATESMRSEMTRLEKLPDVSGGYIYSTSAPASRAVSDYTVRIIPYYSNVSVPLEAANILWQR